MGRLLILLDQLPELFTRVTSLEGRMATQEEIQSRVNTVTNNLASDIASIRQQFDDLRSAQEAGEAEAISTAMDALIPSIENLESVETVLRQMGTTPEILPPDSATAGTAEATGGASDFGASVATNTTALDTASGGSPDDPANPAPGSR